MKIKVKQVWDMKPPKDMTLIQVKLIADAIHKEGDEFFLTHDEAQARARGQWLWCGRGRYARRLASVRY